MEFISFICVFIIMMILFSLIGPFIMYLVPIILLVFFIRMLIAPRNTHTYYYDNSHQDNTYDNTNSKPKHDAIDVEYTEHDDEASEQ